MVWRAVISNIYLIFGFSVVLTAYFLRRRRLPRGCSLPPGPPGYPIIGNLLDLPAQHEWKTYKDWANSYGDLVYVNVLGTSMAFVNSQELITELFEKRYSIYNDRYPLPMLCDLMKMDWAIPMMPYGERWRKHRQMLTKQFISTANVIWQSEQTKHTRDLLHRLLVSPDAFSDHIRHVTGALILEAVYGLSVLPENDPYVSLIEEALATISHVGRPGAFLVDTLPILKYIPDWLPGAGFQTQAKIGRKVLGDAANVPFKAVKDLLASEKAVPSATAGALERLELGSQIPDEEKTIRNVAANVFAGGADTSACALQIFLIAMMQYPEVQLTAQKALDEVVGLDRLPTFEDRKDLPYITALCKEVLRWHPITPIALPHRLSQDDVIGNYFLPAGTLVVGNAWGLLHSETAYGPDPDKFRPERFLAKGVRDPDYAFGFGKRICPGRYIMQDILFVFISSILHSFTIKPMPGKDCPSHEAFLPGIISHPLPFECSILPRSIAHEKLIRREMTIG